MDFNSSTVAMNNTGLEQTTVLTLAGMGLDNDTLAALTSSLPGPMPRHEHDQDEITISNMPHVLIPPVIWRVFQALHAILTIVALLTNCVSLLVIYGIVPRLTPTLQILTSLAFADMLAPWAIMTIYFPPSACQDEIHTALLLTSHNAAALSLLTLVACQYISVFRPLNYDKIVTQKRIWIIINIIWILSILSAHLHFLLVLMRYNAHTPFCIQVLENTELVLCISAAITGAVIIMGGLILGRIFLELRPISTLAEQNDQPRKCTRSVVTCILLSGTFLVSWIPYLVAKFVQVGDLVVAQHSSALVIVLHACQTLILLNCGLDPVMYGVRMDAMQTGYLTLYHKIRNWVSEMCRSIAGQVETDDQPSTPLNPIESIC